MVGLGAVVPYPEALTYVMLSLEGTKSHERESGESGNEARRKKYYLCHYNEECKLNQEFRDRMNPPTKAALEPGPNCSIHLVHTHPSSSS